jgi:Uma2 family endonuclease
MSVAYKLEPEKKTQKTIPFTYADYLTWPEDGRRWELIDGVPYMMAAPRSNHQITLGELYSEFRNHLRGKKCRVFLSPFDVRLPRNNKKRDNDITTVVQPDLSVYCNPKHYDERGGIGTPELIVEILSPTSGRHDKLRKFKRYEEAGVKEYWLVDPVHEFVDIYRLRRGKFILSGSYNHEDTLPPPSVGCEDLADFTLAVELIFAANLDRPEYNDNEFPIPTTEENEDE